MEDQTHFDILPNTTWEHFEHLYDSAVSQFKEAKRDALRSLRGNDWFRRTTVRKDELLAHWRWSSRILQVVLVKSRLVSTCMRNALFVQQ